MTYYEIDWQNSYSIVRFGKVTKLVEDRFGKKAANVMSNLLALGHTRIADLKEAYFPSETDSGDESDSGIVNGAGNKRKRTNGTQSNGAVTSANGTANGASSQSDGVNGAARVNGTAHDDENKDDEIKSADELYDVIRELIERGWVKTVTDLQYLSPGDVHDWVTQEVLEQEYKGIQPTGIKEKDRMLRFILQRKREMRDAWLTAPKFSRSQSNGTDYGSSNKRVKINGSNGWTAGGAQSNEDSLVVRVNPDKIAVAMRTEQLVRLVEQRSGYVTARIYETMLRMVEAHTPCCYEEFVDPPLPGGQQPEEIARDPHTLVTARDVAKHLSKEVDVCEGLDPNAVVLITHKGHVRSSNILSQPIDPTKLTLDEKTRLVDKHIMLLSDDPFHFVTWHSRAGFSQWHIEFNEIAKQLIQTEVENTIYARKGKLGVKLIRALRKKGRLDERATCNTMMMSATDIRGIINDLTVQGFVQTQEIPKVERREAKHSLHLVWYDRQRAREKLLHDTYKGMVRILQRIAFERDKVQPLLTKAERSDVVGNEEKWLSKAELGALKKWREVQEKLLLQLFREDDLVATLRDFYGPLAST